MNKLEELAELINENGGELYVNCVDGVWSFSVDGDFNIAEVSGRDFRHTLEQFEKDLEEWL